MTSACSLCDITCQNLWLRKQFLTEIMNIYCCFGNDCTKLRYEFWKIKNSFTLNADQLNKNSLNTGKLCFEFMNSKRISLYPPIIRFHWSLASTATISNRIVTYCVWNIWYAIVLLLKFSQHISCGSFKRM